jgi:hypothetical protein
VNSWPGSIGSEFGSFSLGPPRVRGAMPGGVREAPAPHRNDQHVRLDSLTTCLIAVIRIGEVHITLRFAGR